MNKIKIKLYEENMMSEKIEKKSSIIAYSVFIFTLAIVFLNIVSLIFPALLLASSISLDSRINPFEIGAWASPLLTADLSVLSLAILYYRKRLPDIITRSFRFILSFEVSRKIAALTFLVIIVIYIAFSVWELTLKEADIWADWKVVSEIINSFPNGGDEQALLKGIYVNNFLLYVSQEFLHNVKIIPFLASIALVFLTYLLTVKISQKRFAGLVATVILLQSHTFLRYDTTATYNNFWTVFYLASLYLIYVKWPLSPLAFVASVFSKALSIAFIPMTLFFAIRSKTKAKTKIGIVVSFIIVIVAAIVALLIAGGLGYGQSLKAFDGLDFVSGLTTWAYQLRIDGLVLLFLLPVTVGLFIKSREGKTEAESILVLIAGILLSVPLLAGFTEFNIQPYRWIPLIAFFAIGVGTLLSKTSANRPQD